MGGPSCHSCSTPTARTAAASSPPPPPEMAKKGNDHHMEFGNSEGLELLRKSLKHIRAEGSNDNVDEHTHIFVVFGASGDLAKKKIYPTLWAIYKDNLLPPGTKFVGYSRSKISVDDIKERCKPWFKVKEGEEEKAEQFWAANSYVAGGYDQRRDFEMLTQEMERHEKAGKSAANRLFYLA